MRRIDIAQYIALGATALTVIGVCLSSFAGLDFGVVLVAVGMLAGIVSYFFGGFGTAIKMSAGIAKWGWVIAPFPADIFTFLICFVIAIMVFLFIPIFPVRRAFKEKQ